MKIITMFTFDPRNRSIAEVTGIILPNLQDNDYMVELVQR